MSVALLAQYVVIVAEASRLPMVAGWDSILLARFMRLHPRFKTPVLSIATMSGLGLAAGLLSLIGTGSQEAYQLIVESANLCFGLYYMLMFLVPLLMRGGFRLKPAPWLKLAAASGLTVTVLAIFFSLVPIVTVPNRWIFAAKIVVTTGLMNLMAALVYRAKARPQTA